MFFHRHWSMMFEKQHECWLTIFEIFNKNDIHKFTTFDQILDNCMIWKISHFKILPQKQYFYSSKTRFKTPLKVLNFFHMFNNKTNISIHQKNKLTSKHNKKQNVLFDVKKNYKTITLSNKTAKQKDQKISLLTFFVFLIILVFPNCCNTINKVPIVASSSRFCFTVIIFTTTYIIISINRIKFLCSSAIENFF